MQRDLRAKNSEIKRLNFMLFFNLNSKALRNLLGNCTSSIIYDFYPILYKTKFSRKLMNILVDHKLCLLGAQK